MNKKNGEVHQFIIQMVGIICSFAILLYSIYYLSTIIIYNNVNQTARKYILRMEKQGYLDSSDRYNIIDELENDNISSVNVTFSSEGKSEKVNYGEDIKITINCTVKQKSIDFSSFPFKTTESDQTLVVTKASSAKW
ncbi:MULTISPECIES: DUF4320 family protein [Clostridium]|jgi:uncharacterized membrane protein YhiD involved in acid resistance|uniref:DUF4320 family protein n=1 Tax=Clostridium TaxID=1485 RepID=UPI001D7C3ACD|nr:MULTISPECIES: DUF4320 family protein [Clostridium]MBS5308669.1 DUF4320 family protein [Clostridium sp.]MDB1933154.1 DUF4320 family protein [Clostridium tertium]MDB1938158.1 DUF4320 family protein [Clostridium tertium]MDB1944089.1 DUF4320 family protein [Clostridium tertium]MDB1950747.1 DUF4320 family protein [Clostridium tertium]